MSSLEANQQAPSYYSTANMNPVDRCQAWRLNWYRQSELEGALLLGKMVKTAVDPWVSYQLTKHCAEEANHSLLWNGVIRELKLPTIRIFRSYQSFFLREGNHPKSLVEVLAFTQIFERRVHQTFTRELKDPKTPEPAKKAYLQMLHDEKGHLSWVADWLKQQSTASGLLERYQRIDETVFAILEPYRERLWDIEFLGSET